MEKHNMLLLPEDCVSMIVSFTTPHDACRSSLVSTAFRSAADCDVVWDKFLPCQYQDIVSGSTTALNCSSKKQLFLRLCDSVLIDGGRKSFKLEKSSGKISYMLSARDISITWSDEPMYWSWISLPESRFNEVAVLRTMSWLEIQGKIKTTMLSENTKYAAYLILKISDRAYGLDIMPSETSIEVGNQIVCTNTAYLRDAKQVNIKQIMEGLFYRNRTEMLKPRITVNQVNHERVPCEREDGWLEIELGEFFVGDHHHHHEQCPDGEEVKVKFTEVKGQNLKGGLVIEGIELRPKK